jgi:hypothetical protein
MIRIIVVVFFALALVTLLRGTMYFINLMGRKKTWYPYVLQIYPWVEVVVWIFFTFWFIDFFIDDKTLFTIAVSAFAIIVIVLLGWYVMRDFIAGAVFRSSHALEAGVEIKTPTVAGIISHLGYTSMEIHDAEGIKIRINYCKLNNQDVTVVTDPGRGKSHSVVVDVPRHYGAQHIEQTLSRKLLEIPWIIAEDDIKIIMHAHDECYKTEMTFYSLNEEMFIKTEELLRNYVKEVFP